MMPASAIARQIAITSSQLVTSQRSYTNDQNLICADPVSCSVLIPVFTRRCGLLVQLCTFAELDLIRSQVVEDEASVIQIGPIEMNKDKLLPERNCVPFNSCCLLELPHRANNDGLHMQIAWENNKRTHNCGVVTFWEDVT
jgi:hypothetical protein